MVIVAFGNEIFFTNRELYFERNRAHIAINIKTSEQTIFQVGYLHQFDYKINDETGRDFLIMGFYYQWNRMADDSRKIKTEQQEVSLP